MIRTTTSAALVMAITAGFVAAQQPVKSQAEQEQLKAELSDVKDQLQSAQVQLEKLMAALNVQIADQKQRIALLSARRLEMEARMAMLAQKFGNKQTGNPFATRWVAAAKRQQHWQIGVAVEPVDKSAKRPGLKITRLVAGGAAEKAKLKTGDRIVALNGIKLKSVQMLTQLIGAIEGQEVTLLVRRDNDKEPVEVKVTPVQARQPTAASAFFWRASANWPQQGSFYVVPQEGGNFRLAPRTATYQQTRLNVIEERLARLEALLKQIAQTQKSSRTKN